MTSYEKKAPQPIKKASRLIKMAPQPISDSKFKPTFTVKEFLMALYDENHHESILRIPSQVLNAEMNFTHFVPAGENLSPGVIPRLSHDLLRRSAAMQLAFCQPTYDIMIPIYFGDSNKEFDESQCGAILIQVKNKNDATTLREIFRETFTNVSPEQRGRSKKAADDESIRDGENFVFNKMAHPLLFLLFDLGIETKPRATSPLVQVSRNSNGRKPDVWAIHSRGHDASVFGCLKHMDCETNSKMFFVSTILDRSVHDNLCRRNHIFL